MKHYKLSALSAALFSLFSIQNPVMAETTENVKYVEAITVTATRTENSYIETPAAVTLQEMEKVRDMGFTYGTDEFRGVTGVFFRRGEGGGDEFPFVSFRGSIGTEGSLSLIDGIPIVGVYDELQLNEIPYDAIDLVEIVKGPVSALYGRGALYGVTNYRTITADENLNSVKFTLGEDRYVRANYTAERLMNNTGLVLSVTTDQYDGWRENGGRDLNNLFVKLSTELTDDTEVTAYLNYNDRDSEMPNGRVLDENGKIMSFNGGDEEFIGYKSPNNDMQTVLAALRFETELSDKLSSQLTFSLRNIERDTRLNFFDSFGTFTSANIVGYNGFRNDTKQNVFFVEGLLNWNSGNHNVIMGASHERSISEEKNFWSGQNGFTPECDFTFYSIQADIKTGELLNLDHPCFETDTLLADNEFENDFWGVFIQGEFLLSESWRLLAGLRYDDFSRDAQFFPIEDLSEGGKQSGSANALSPKVTLSYLEDWGQIYATSGRGFNSNFGATFEWDPVQYHRPETRPTIMDSIEIGMKARLSDNTQFDVAVFSSEQTNRRQIVANPAAADDFSQPFNLVTYGDNYQSQGVELSFVSKLGDDTSLRLGYTHINAEWEDYTVGGTDYSGNKGVGVPENMYFVMSSHQFADWFELNGQYESYDDYYYTVDNEFSNGGYQVLSLHGKIQPASWSSWAVDISVSNVFDEEYYYYFGNQSTPTYATPGEPRQVRVSVSGLL